MKLAFGLPNTRHAQPLDHPINTPVGHNPTPAHGASDSYDITRTGAAELEALGIDVGSTRALRRRFANACVDWSERRSHIGGALGAALRELAMRRGWIVQDLDSRILRVTGAGRREMQARFEVRV